MKNLFNLLFLIIPFVLSAQDNGTVTYTEKLNIDLSKIKIEGEGINSEDFVSMMSNNMEKETVLNFTNSESLYENIKKEKPTNQNLISGMSFFSKEKDTYIYYNVDKKETSSAVDIFGRDFIVISKAKESKWKITKEQKIIQGFLCFKAVRTGKNNEEIVIWFTPKVKVDAAPLGIMNVPGLVLRLEKDEGRLTIEATSVKLGVANKEKIIAPTKGKKITSEKMEEIKEEKIEEMQSQFQGEGIQTTISISK